MLNDYIPSIDDLHKLIDLDKEVYPNDYLVCLDDILGYLKTGGHKYIIIKDDFNNVCGYLVFSFVKQDTFNKVKDSKNYDESFIFDNLVSCTESNSIYFGSIVVSSKYGNITTLRKLLKKFKLVLKEYKPDFLFNVAVSDEGYRLAKMFKFNEVKKFSDNSVLFHRKYTGGI